MVDIISKRSGPRDEDVRARSFIERNRGTITKLADQISNGAYSAARQARADPGEPQPSGLVIADFGSVPKSDDPRPYVRVSPNRRVVVVDQQTSRQMHLLGVIRRIDGKQRFVLATKANGFFAVLDDVLAECLSALDGASIGGERTEAVLSSEIATLLGYDQPTE